MTKKDQTVGAYCHTPLQIVGFLCNWCSYAGADLAGVSRLQYPDDIRIIRVPCSGRINPLLVLKCFQEGADGVLVSGCHPGDCHYQTGNLYARRRMHLFKALLEYFGIDKRRFHMSWVSASEGRKWADTVTKVVEDVRAARQEKVTRDQSIVSSHQSIVNSHQSIVTGGLETSGHPASSIQYQVKQLLESRSVRLVIGYGVSSGGDTIPLFVREPDEAEKLVWNEHCVYNLARYLTDRDLLAAPAYAGADPTSIGIVTKGCDLKSINVLLGESQIKRERIKIVGVACQGMKDEQGEPLEKCEVCEVSNPDESLCDVVIGEPKASPVRKPMEDSFQDVKEIDSLKASEKRAFWDRHFSRCLRCYACRSICPLCYCEECVLEQHNPQWVSPAPSVKENRAFHVIRAYHLAGRCIDCGECERACPVGIPLRRINRKMAQVVKESYSFEAGKKGDRKSPITWFSQDDPEEFIK